jgi:hypothetical protein
MLLFIRRFGRLACVRAQVARGGGGGGGGGNTHTHKQTNKHTPGVTIPQQNYSLVHLRPLGGGRHERWHERDLLQGQSKGCGIWNSSRRHMSAEKTRRRCLLMLPFYSPYRHNQHERQQQLCGRTNTIHHQPQQQCSHRHRLGTSHARGTTWHARR